MCIGITSISSYSGILVASVGWLYRLASHRFQMYGSFTDRRLLQIHSKSLEAEV